MLDRTSHYRISQKIRWQRIAISKKGDLILILKGRGRKTQTTHLDYHESLMCQSLMSMINVCMPQVTNTTVPPNLIINYLILTRLSQYATNED